MDKKGNFKGKICKNVEYLHLAVLFIFSDILSHVKQENVVKCVALISVTIVVFWNFIRIAKNCINIFQMIKDRSSKSHKIKIKICSIWLLGVVSI